MTLLLKLSAMEMSMHMNLAASHGRGTKCFRQSVNFISEVIVPSIKKNAISCKYRESILEKGHPPWR